jgi:hypothetical protein
MPVDEILKNSHISFVMSTCLSVCRNIATQLEIATGR